MKKALIATNIFTVVLLAIVLLKSNRFRNWIGIEDNNPNQGISAYAEPNSCNYSIDQIEFFLEQKNKRSNIIMLGNSMVSRGNWQTLLNRNDVSNLGIAGDGVACIRKRTKYLHNLGARIWFLEGGINDMQAMTIDSICAQYDSLISFVKNEQAIPVIVSVFYVSPLAGATGNGREEYKEVNALIKSLNGRLFSLCKETGAEYLDMNSMFADDNNILKSEMTTDGIHLSERAYSLWAIKILDVLKKYQV